MYCKAYYSLEARATPRPMISAPPVDFPFHLLLTSSQGNFTASNQNKNNTLMSSKLFHLSEPQFLPLQNGSQEGTADCLWDYRLVWEFDENHSHCSQHTRCTHPHKTVHMHPMFLWYVSMDLLIVCNPRLRSALSLLWCVEKDPCFHAGFSPFSNPSTSLERF